MSKSDVKTLRRGLKRMVFALATAALFALSVWAFIGTATAPGYVAVLLFLAAILWLGMALILLYSMGITRRTRMESKGERK